jgi:hypothetical protein
MTTLATGILCLPIEFIKALRLIKVNKLRFFYLYVLIESIRRAHVALVSDLRLIQLPGCFITAIATLVTNQKSFVGYIRYLTYGGSQRNLYPKSIKVLPLFLLIK